MIIRTNKLKSFDAKSKDNIEGKISDFYFDDLFWNIQYIILETGRLLKEESVIISHVAFGEPDMDNETVSVQTTLKDIDDDTERTDAPKTVSEIKEEHGAGILKWPLNQLNLKTLSRGEIQILLTNMLPKHKQEFENSDNLHLRSMNEVESYHIMAKDGEIGHVEDFLVDSENWKIRYFVINTRNWLPGGKDVLISPAWIERISWNDNTVHIDLKKEAIENSPPYDPDEPITEEFELKLFRFYGYERHKENGE